MDIKIQAQRKKEFNLRIEKITRKLDKNKRKLNEITEMNNRRFNYINSIFMAMQDGIVVFDANNELILINPSGQNFLGVDNRIFFNEHNQKHQAFFQRIHKEAELTLEKAENRLVHFDSEKGRHYDIQSSIIENKYKKNEYLGTLVVVIDVTEKRNAEKLRKEFVENVSHEFRTPMTLITGFVEMFRMWDNLDPEDRKRALDIIDIETARLKRLISELMTLSQIEGNFGSKEQLFIDVEDVIEDVITTLQPIAAKKGITIFHDLQLEYPIIMGNDQFFFQAISNLVGNAIIYSPECGWVRIQAYNDHKQCTIKVSDGGVGIAQEHLHRIFERFYRVDKARNSKTGGSGIGLSIVKNVVAMMNGHIEVESQLNIGTIFTITIPITEDSLK